MAPSLAGAAQDLRDELGAVDVHSDISEPDTSDDEVARATATAKRTCSACPAHTYQAQAGHRITSCAVQPTCGAGQQMSPDTATSARYCSGCPPNTFQSQTSHRDVACTSQPVCGAGQVASPDTTKAQRTCSDCPSNTYQPSAQHLSLINI